MIKFQANREFNEFSLSLHFTNVFFFQIMQSLILKHLL